MPKKFLLIRADEKAIPNKHVESLEANCIAYELNFQSKDVQTEKELSEALTGKYDYICFAGHGNELQFGDEKELSVSWDKIGDWICERDSLKINGIVMLYCCKGGLPEVGCNLVDKCPRLDFILGPTDIEISLSLLTAYSLFIYHIEINNHEPADALHLVQDGTGVLLDHYHAGDRDPDTGDYYCKRCREEDEDYQEC